MANEVVTTTTTLAGVIERVQADLTADLLIQSVLLDAFLSQDSAGAATGQFPTFPAPVGDISAQTEANDPTKRAVSIAGNTITLASFPAITRMSKVAFRGGAGVNKMVMAILMNDLVASVDTYLASLITTGNFTATPIDDVTSKSSFLTAKSMLENVGYAGRLHFIGTPHMISGILDNVSQGYFQQLNDQFASQGYVTTVFGVNFFQVPSGRLPSVSSRKAGLIYNPSFAVGVLKGNPIIEVTIMEVHNNIEIGATAYLRATAMSATAGLICKSDSATL